MSSIVGQKAPEFSLIDSDKNTHKLSDHRGKNVLLLFYPAAFTGVCTKELCATRDDLARFNGLNVDVFGISVDMPFTLARFKDENKLNFPLLSDFNKEAITSYGVKYEEWILGLKGVAKRATIVIDKDGIIRHAEVLEDAGNYPDFDAVNKTLASLQ
jgi:peroxiredoxin